VFETADFERVAHELNRLKGRFILSVNDAIEVRWAFRSFAVEEIEMTNTICKGAAQGGRRELVISSGDS
jgi:DNA adenine methylase